MRNRKRQRENEEEKEWEREWEREYKRERIKENGWEREREGEICDWNENKNFITRSVLHDYTTIFFSLPNQSDLTGL